MSAFEEFMAAYPAKVQELASRTRTLIRKTIPQVQEFVDPPSKIVAYGFSPKYADLVCAIAPYKSYLNLVFAKGTQLCDPAKLLVGRGKRARHVKIGDAATLENPALEALIEQAVALTNMK